MENFDYLVGLISIVVGLGLAEVASQGGDGKAVRDTVTTPPVAWRLQR